MPDSSQSVWGSAVNSFMTMWSPVGMNGGVEVASVLKFVYVVLQLLKASHTVTLK